MRKFNLGNKRSLIILGTIIALLISGAVYYKFYTKPQSSNVNEGNSGKKEETVGTNKEESPKSEDVKEGPVQKEAVSYEISNLNKKDGDVFSVPDEVTFTISPTVDKSKITLMSSEGTVLYTGETIGSEAKFTVYPAKKVIEGSQGTLLIEGFSGSEAVVSKKIGIVF